MKHPRKLIATLAIAFGLALMALAIGATQAQATPPAPRPSVTITVDCGTATLTGENPTDFEFAYDYRVDDEAATNDFGTGPVYEIADMPAGAADVTRTVTFDEDSGDHTIMYRINLGAEQDWYQAAQTVTVKSDCQPDASPPPTTSSPSPSTTPLSSNSTATHTSTPPLYANCDAVRAAGKAPLHKGQPGYRAALDRDNDGVACESNGTSGPPRSSASSSDEAVVVPAAQTPAAEADSADLASTGAPIALPAIAGGLLLAVGGLVTLAARRRYAARHQ